MPVRVFPRKTGRQGKTHPESMASSHRLGSRLNKKRKWGSRLSTGFPFLCLLTHHDGSEQSLAFTARAGSTVMSSAPGCTVRPELWAWIHVPSSSHSSTAMNKATKTPNPLLSSSLSLFKGSGYSTVRGGEGPSEQSSLVMVLQIACHFHFIYQEGMIVSFRLL